uniref:Uncharacterized protein n=1 Tax=Timema bartmani TaxID=61472 RepID=A0A7R9F0R6_9NEOP|nr:unnamed protein product [Timema bartmani]
MKILQTPEKLISSIVNKHVEGDSVDEPVDKSSNYNLRWEELIRKKIIESKSKFNENLECHIVNVFESFKNLYSVKSYEHFPDGKHKGHKNCKISKSL